MRCVVSAPVGVEIAALYRVLEQLEISAVPTSVFGPGGALADASLEDVDCAIAILPFQNNSLIARTAAVYIDIGILLGRHIPLLVFAEKSLELGTALTNANLVYTDLDNADALELHVELFISGLPQSETSDLDGPPLPIPDLDRYRALFTQLQDDSSKDSIIHARELEQGVARLLRDCGAIIQERNEKTERQVDIAAYLPGREKSLGLLVVEVKAGKMSAGRLRIAQQELAIYVLNSRSGVGLLLYEGLPIEAEATRGIPMTISVSIDELLSRLALQPLDKVINDLRYLSILRF